MTPCNWKAGLFACTTALTMNATAGPSLDPLDLDPTFAGDGTLIIEPEDRAYAFAGMIDEAGEILVFGHADDGSPSTREAKLHRILGDGTVIPLASFGATGFGCEAPRTFLTGIRLSNGDYVGAGWVQDGCSGIPRYFDAKRLTPAGIQVDAFDNVVFNSQIAYILALGEQSSGNIVAAGFASGSGSINTTFDIAVARFTPTGALDPTFGTSGIFTLDNANDLDWSSALVIDDADRILIAGYSTSAQGDRDMLVIRLNPDGTLDTTFDGDGQFYYDDAGFDDSASAIDLAPNGRILVGGAVRDSQDQLSATILGITDNGTLDTNFGSHGVATVDLGNTEAAIADIHYDASRIYVAGWSRAAGGERIDIDAAVTVLRSDGTPNDLYNNGQSHVFVFDAALGDQSDFPQSIDVSKDGLQIVVTGYTDDEPRTRQRYGVARFIGLEHPIFLDGFEDSAQ